MDLIPLFGMLTGVLITLGSLAAVVVAIYYVTKAKHTERMTLIEKGVDVSGLYRRTPASPDAWKKTGIVFIGLSLGILMGEILATVTPLEKVTAYFVTILLFGGLSIFLTNRIIHSIGNK